MCLFSWSVSLLGNGNYTFLPSVYYICHRRVNCTESLRRHRLWVSPVAREEQKPIESLTPAVIDLHLSFELQNDTLCKQAKCLLTFFSILSWKQGMILRLKKKCLGMQLGIMIRSAPSLSIFDLHLAKVNTVWISCLLRLSWSLLPSISIDCTSVFFYFFKDLASIQGEV